MPTINLTTFIAAPAERVFDLSRSIDLHKKSMAHTSEQAVNGTTSGLIGLNETVTWKAKHFFKTRILRVKVTQMNSPISFTDEMIAGDLKSMKHEHHFKQIENGTLLIDLFHYELPYGALGRTLNKLFFRSYLSKLLERRNSFIKQYAESDKWSLLIHR